MQSGYRSCGDDARPGHQREPGPNEVVRNTGGPIYYRGTQPWKRSTGPKTAAGKAVSSRNAYKGGVRPALRMLARVFRGL